MTDSRQDKYLAEVVRLIGEHGWALQGVFPTQADPGPHFTYTVGLGLLDDHPEIVVFDLPYQVAGPILNMVGALVRHEHELIEPGDTRQGIIGNDLPVTFLRVDPEVASEYVTVANKLYGVSGPVPVLQMVWPDDKGNWPWQETWNTNMNQTVIGETP